MKPRRTNPYQNAAIYRQRMVEPYRRQVMRAAKRTTPGQAGPDSCNIEPDPQI
jgi:hypothetical protein